MQKVCTEGHTIFLHVHVIIKTRIFNLSFSYRERCQFGRYKYKCPKCGSLRSDIENDIEAEYRNKINVDKYIDRCGLKIHS